MDQTEIEMIPVESSTVAKYGYDSQSKRLVVQFKYQSRVYFVDGFAPEDWEAFQAAGSKGKFFASQVKTRYTVRKD